MDIEPLKQKSKIFLDKTKIFLRDYFHLVFKSAADNHLRLQTLKQGRMKAMGTEEENIKPETTQTETALEFNSYSHLKRYQQKVRLLTFSSSSTLALVLAVVMIFQTIGFQSRGATFGWIQESWSGTAGETLANHASNRSGWTGYTSKDSSIDVSNDELKLTTTSDSTVQTDDNSGFSGGTKSSVESSGTAIVLTDTPGVNYADSFSYTGSVDSWTVPDGINSINITADGAGGAGYEGYVGGVGGRSVGSLTVTPGQIYYVSVGGGGSGTAGGYGGGGNGSEDSSISYGRGGGGMTELWLSNYSTSTSSIAIGKGSKTFTVQPGLSFSTSAGAYGNFVMIVDSADTSKWMAGVVTSYSGTSLVINVTLTKGSGTIATWNISPVIIIAGGGGGGAGGTSGFSGSGGAGGGSNGGFGSGTHPGKGGSQTAGGAAGCIMPGCALIAGSAGSGGHGGGTGSAGGGGGLFGGGESFDGAGGGSGYIDSSLTSASTTAGGGSTGNGSLSIAYATPTTYPASGSFTSDIIDTGHGNASWGDFAWTTTHPSSATQIVFKVRSSNNADMSGATAFSSCTAIATTTSANATGTAAMAGNSCVNASDRYVQYEATLSSSDSLVTPEINDVTVNYNFYANAEATNTQTSDTDFNADGSDYGSSTTELNGTTGANSSIMLKSILQSITDTFSYTGNVQSWVVPNGVTSATITVNGAGGGSYFSGAGGSSTGTLTVTSGTNYYVAVGGAGTGDAGITGTGGYGGGGSGANSTLGSFGGGGMTWFSTQNTFAQDSVILVAGGGGGMGSGTATAYGGSGGGTSGGKGTDTGAGTGGSGGTQSAGGAAGTGNGAKGTAGSAGTGGAGNSTSSNYYGGGGGGGGYYGGGAGVNATSGSTAYRGSGGGGGSGYIKNTLTNASTTAGAGAGTATNGNASISYTQLSYPSSGTYTSAPINVGQAYWGTLSWEETVVSGQAVTMQARSATTSAGLTSKAWGSCTVTNGNSLLSSSCVSSGDSWIQYQATLTTNDTSASPSLDSVTITYHPYASGTLTSSPFNAESSGSVMSKLIWSETLPANTDVKFQVATSADNATYTDFLGPDGTTGTYFTDPLGDEGMPNVFQAGGNDQYFKYKAYLSSSTGTSTPSLQDITTKYVVNAPPNFESAYGTNGVNVSQISDSEDDNWGKVQIDYSIRDIDATTGNQTANYVTPTFEYSTNGGSSWTDVNLANITFGAAPTSGSLTGNITDTNSDGKLDNKVFEPTLDGNGNETAANYLTYTAYWDAKTQIDNTYSSNFKIRVKVNDNEGANNTALAIGNTTSIDTKNPTVGTHPILIDATPNTPEATLDATDNSTLKMEVNLTNSFSSVLAESYNSSKTITLATDPDTVYAKFQDIYGNETLAYSATTPETPDKIMIQDTSNVMIDPTEPRLFLAWKTVVAPTPGFGSYKIYRSQNQSDWELKFTIDNRSTNYYSEAVDYDENYYYKVVTVDADGNKSYESDSVNGKANGVQDAGEGGGGTITTPPVISNVDESNVTTIQAVINWDTDTLSNSTVGYSTTSGDYDDFTTAVNEMKNDAAHQGQHRVVLTGLNPNTTYYYRVTSEDANGNSANSSEGTFLTAQGPEITNVIIKDVSNNQVTIAWRTDTDSNTIVNYATSVTGTSLSNPATVGADSTNVGGESPFVHERTITGLLQNTVYYFSVQSEDDSDNMATDDNGTNFYSFTTDLDEDAPTISGITEPIIDSDQAAIFWTTDEPATSQVRYSTTSGGSYTDTTEVSALDTGHYVILTGLSANTRYYYRVVSRDISGNSATSGEENFTTTVDEEFNHAAISDISDIDVPTKHLSDNNAIVSFTTDQSALCFVELSTSEGSYSNPVIAYESGYDNEADYNKSHVIRLIDLIAETPYYFKITCHDNIIEDASAEDDADKFANWVTSSEEDFTTLETQIGESEVAGGDTTEPEISGVSVSTITGESATISWDTDENANSLVRYGITSEYGSMAGDDLVNMDSANYSKAHEVILHGLIPGTKYLYTVSSIDTSGNIAESSEGSFKTSSPSSLSSIKVESKSLGEATITWNTSKETTSLVEYGLETDYGEKKESSSYAKEHSVSLTNLDQGVTYHYRVKGEDKDGNLYASADNTFEPKSPAKISGVNINDITEHGATITFETNEPTDAEISYTSTDDSNETGSQGTRELSKDHKIILTNLKQGTTYSLKISARDEEGTEATADAPDLTTGKDENPPVIDQVRTDSALTQNDKVQTIISWKTDEQSTTVLLYREGRNGEEKEYKVGGDSLTAGHIAVITTFKPGTVYSFKVKSTDASGNTATSSQYTLLTPRRRENIIQIITNNFQDIFGWMGNAR